MKTIIVLIFLVSGSFSVSREEAKVIAENATKKTIQAELALQTPRFILHRNIVPDFKFNSFSVAQQQHFIYLKYKQRIDRYRAVGIYRQNVHFILPPMVDEAGVRWIGGVAATSSACRGLGFSVSNATAYALFGSPRIVKSSLVAIHELLHTFGAQHVEKPINIMSSYLPADYQIQELAIMPQTVAQISKCLSSKIL